jgi:hypothetical protein
MHASSEFGYNNPAFTAISHRCERRVTLREDHIHCGSVGVVGCVDAAVDRQATEVDGSDCVRSIEGSIHTVGTTAIQDRTRWGG